MEREARRGCGRWCSGAPPPGGSWHRLRPAEKGTARISGARGRNTASHSLSARQPPTHSSARAAPWTRAQARPCRPGEGATERVSNATTRTPRCQGSPGEQGAHRVPFRRAAKPLTVPAHARLPPHPSLAISLVTGRQDAKQTRSDLHMGKTNALRGEHARHGHPARPVDDTPLSTAQPARHAKRPRARAAHGATSKCMV